MYFLSSTHHKKMPSLFNSQWIFFLLNKIETIHIKSLSIVKNSRAINHLHITTTTNCWIKWPKVYNTIYTTKTVHKVYFKWLQKETWVIILIDMNKKTKFFYFYNNCVLLHNNRKMNPWKYCVRSLGETGLNITNFDLILITEYVVVETHRSIGWILKTNKKRHSIFDIEVNTSDAKGRLWMNIIEYAMQRIPSKS